LEGKNGQAGKLFLPPIGLSKDFARGEHASKGAPLAAIGGGVWAQANSRGPIKREKREGGINFLKGVFRPGLDEALKKKRDWLAGGGNFLNRKGKSKGKNGRR